MTENRQEPGRSEEPFFESIRRSGWFRAEPRWIAGVCSGISVRTGWDVRLVRGIAIVLTLLFWIPIALYALAWFVLPNGPNGRIEAQELFAGRFDWAQLGAGVMLLIGIGSLPATFVWAPSAALWWILVIGGAVALIVYFSTSGSGTSPNVPAERVQPMSSQQPGPYGPPTPQGHQGPRGSAHVPSGQAGQPGVPPQYQPPPYQAAQYPPTPTSKYYYPKQPAAGPVISNAVAFSALGVLLLIAAGGIVLTFNSWAGARVVLATIGLIVALTGAVLAWAALTGRRGGWFLGFSIAGAILILPATALGMGLAGLAANIPHHSDYVDYGVEESIESEIPAGDYGYDEGPAESADITGANAWVESPTSQVRAAEASVIWDLTDAPYGTYDYSLDAYGSKVTILLSKDRLPEITVWERADGSLTATAQDRAVSSADLNNWVESEFVEIPTGISSAPSFTLGITALNSDVEFVFLSSDQLDRVRQAWTLAEESPTKDWMTETSQSGPQSGN